MAFVLEAPHPLGESLLFRHVVSADLALEGDARAARKALNDLLLAGAVFDPWADDADGVAGIWL
jgi:hypothetical protein